MQSVISVPRSRDEPQPFRREELVEGNVFLRWIAAQVKAELTNTPIELIAARDWPNDHVLEMVVRATSAPAQTTVAGWAAELARKRVADGVAGLEPMSAGAQLLSGGLVLAFDNYGSISVPGFVAAAANAGFVAEGAAIPVRQLTAVAATLLPYKLASIAALTQEMVNSSNAEALISDALMRSAGLALDQALFDSNPASASRPAGLRNGITALTASNNSTASEAALEDIAALFNGVGQVGGQGPYVLVTSPGRAMTLRARLSAYRGANDELLTGLVLGTPAVGSDVLAVAQSALVSAFSPDPDLEASNASTLVMDDTAPANPDTTQPTKSLFQTASVAVKMRWPIAWALRDPRGVAWMTPVWK
jgi:Phage capsid family